MKTCTKCQISKELTEFSKHKKGKDGKDSQCKNCKNIYSARKRNINPLGRLYHFKNGAKCRKYDWKLTDNEATQLFYIDCHYCGEEPDVNKQLMGIDRKDSGIGYLQNNVVACCGMCNMMKQSYGYEVFIARCHKISKHMI